MSKSFCYGKSRRCLALPIGLGLLFPSWSVVARELTGESATVTPADVPEAWILHQRSQLTIQAGASALGVRAENGSQISLYGSIANASGDGIQLINSPGVASGEFSQVRLFDGSSVSGTASGARLGGGADFLAVHSTVLATQGFGILALSTDARLTEGTRVTGQQGGMRIYRDDRGEALLPTFRRVSIDNSSVSGIDGSGVLINTLSPRSGDTDASVVLTNGATVTGGNGIAFELDERTSATIEADDSQILGNMVVADGASAALALRNGAILQGGIQGDVTADIASSAVWKLTADSALSGLAFDGGGVAFQPSGDGSHRVLIVRGDFSGLSGAVSLNTNIDAVGPLGAQATDRLLIEGNVTTTGTTLVTVTPTGHGVPTDTNANDTFDADEGISLIQVAGTSRADAFALNGGYLAIGGFRYGLKAFGPGETDPAQNALGSGSLNWDYRLGHAECTSEGCGPTDPGAPDPGNPDPGNPDPGNPDPGNPDPGNPDPGNPDEPGTPEPPPVERAEVVPQLPSYLSAPAALLTYGDMLNDGLRQRLGDIRNGDASAPLGGEVFARYLGGQLHYESNRSFQNYGYDFDQQVNALQIGGSLISLDGDNGTLRAGWAFDQGSTGVSPQAVDGASSTKYDANGLTGWITWQAGSGWWVDAVVAGQRYRGDVGTDARGADVARIHATGTTISAEAGKAFTLGGDWVIEPRVQMKYQTLHFDPFADADSLVVDLGTARQTSTRIGALLSRIANPRLMPYARLDLTHTSNGDPSATVSSEAWGVADRFGSGRVGNSVRVAAGATSQLTPHVQLYGEGTYQRFVGSYGLRGWSGNLGVRVTF